ncbi:DNA polymerase I [Eubacteriales bacterium KG127]
MSKGVKKKLLAIDGTSLIYRSFYAIQSEMRNKEGQSTRGIYGFLSMLFKLIDDYTPDYFAVAWDLKSPTFRHKSYAEYKGNRKPMPPDLATEIPLLKEVLEALDIKNLSLEGYEADDILGTLAHQGEKAGIDVLIVTGDKDALQLATDTTKIMINRVGISNFVIYDKQEILSEYGMTPDEFIDLKALMGDSSDNIRGVPGVGKVTGVKLIQKYKSIENLIANYKEITKPKLKSSIEANIDNLVINKELVTIVKDVPIEFSFGDLKYDNIDREKVKEWFVKLDFKRFQKLLNLDDVSISETSGIVSDKNELEGINIQADFDLSNILDKIKNCEEVYLKIFTDNNHLFLPIVDKLGIAFKDEDSFEGILVREKKDIIYILSYLSDNQIGIVGHDIKPDIFAALSMKISNLTVKYDTQIAEYVINPSKRDYNIGNLALGYLTADKISKNEDDELWFGNYFVAVDKIRECQKKILSEGKLLNLLNEIELPLISVLAEMEYNGIAVDGNVLDAMGKEFASHIKVLEEEIYSFAGEEFNINSPSQLGVILFEKLNLPFAKKTKRGYSTSADILEKLMNHHPIVEKILEYRAVSKLKGTYVDGLIKLISKDGRIRPHFMQTVAATGRLSCIEPNLQNIPIRTEQGRMIRKGFISGGEDRILVGADYSQIELRILAHLSGDEALINAFNEDEDIHTLTAIKIFGLNPKDVTPLYRSRAKAINFGVIYGMSGFGLSENLDITRKEAEKYIKEYFDKYKSVREYMDKEIKECKSNGFSTTIFGRRRYIGDINATNFMVRKAAERLAMNTPIQGAAADIIKLAMIKVYKRLKAEAPDIKLILQIHDELILEVPIEKKEIAKKILVEEMENATHLAVKLEANPSEGKSWYELK